ncbi:unnamed protein product [Schistosoma haematobium]|nr:unnamed protein product [Schistosoma haematobium]
MNAFGKKIRIYGHRNPEAVSHFTLLGISKVQSLASRILLFTITKDCKILTSQRKVIAIVQCRRGLQQFNTAIKVDLH